MRLATKNDTTRALKILSDAFENNKGINWLVNQQKSKIKNIVKYTYDKCLNNNEVMISEDNNGVIVYSNPYGEKSSFFDNLALLKLVLGTIGLSKAIKVSKKEEHIKKGYPETDFWNLIFIAVDPEKQGQGIGSSLLKSFLKKADDENLAVYLETSTDKNLAFYKNHGFMIYEEWHNPYEGFPIWLLKYEK